MTDSLHTRRALLARLAAAGVACALPGVVPRASAAPWRRIDVRSHGAVGDGTTDDSRAVAAAAAVLTPGSVLHFPPGDYRIARRWPPGGAAIVIAGMSHVGVTMDPGARLLMDNLDADGNGTGHGIAVIGPATGVRLRGCAVEWAPAAARRGHGDGIRVLGYPSDGPPPRSWRGSGGAVRDLVVTGCSVAGSPQAGVILMGCAGARLSGLAIRDTRADGVHVNACRDVSVSGLRVDRPGDDGLAWVTYQDPAARWLGPDGPFARPSLGRWSNSGCRASGVDVRSGAANGVRIAGALDVGVERVRARDVQSGVMVDAGRVTRTNAWQYLASRRCRVRGVVVQGADVGVLVQVFGATAADDPAWWRFDLEVAAARIVGSRRYGLRVEGAPGEGSAVAGVRVRGVRVAVEGGAGASFSALRDGVIDDVRAVGGPVEFLGTPGPVSGPMRALTDQRLRIGRIGVSGAGVLVQDVAWATIDGLSVTDAPLTALDLTRIRDVDVRRVRIRGAGRVEGMARGLLVAKGQRVRVRDVEIAVGTPAAEPWRSVEIGGGDAIDRSHDVEVDRVRYRGGVSGSSDVVVQGGAFAPVRWRCSVRYAAGDGPPRVEQTGDVVTARRRIVPGSRAHATCPRSVLPPRSAPGNAGCPG